MNINHRVHQLKIVFKVTPQMERFVYIYLLEGERCFLIDAGTAGSEKLIADYMSGIGRDISELAGLLLTHSHPDHIGAAAEIKRLTDCRVYAGAGEKSWIEDIDRQFAARPIPNFYGLVGGNVIIDELVQAGDVIRLEDGLTLKVRETSGHSQQSLSYHLLEDRILFTGDAIPVVGDIPIYISARQSMETLRKLYTMEDVEQYCSAWDQVRDSRAGREAIQAALYHLERIDKEVKSIMASNPGLDQDSIFATACEQLDMKRFLVNPLFRTSIISNIENT